MKNSNWEGRIVARPSTKHTTEVQAGRCSQNIWCKNVQEMWKKTTGATTKKILQRGDELCFDPPFL